MQAAVKAVQEAQKAARTGSEGVPAGSATPSMLNEQQQSASAVSTGPLQGGGGAQSASVSSGGAAAGTTSATAQNNHAPDGDSTGKDAKSKDTATGEQAHQFLVSPCCRRLATPGHTC